MRHRAVVRAPKMNFQLLIKVITGIKTVTGIELIVVFAVATFHLAIVARGV